MTFLKWISIFKRGPYDFISTWYIITFIRRNPKILFQKMSFLIGGTLWCHFKICPFFQGGNPMVFFQNIPYFFIGGTLSFYFKIFLYCHRGPYDFISKISYFCKGGQYDFCQIILTNSNKMGQPGYRYPPSEKSKNWN